ncbi:MAG: hypothetical protein ABI576_01240 [Flavobacterium sp.]
MEELLSKLKHFKKISMRKLIITNVMLVATSIFAGSVWYNCKPELISTKIGIIVMIFAMALYLLGYNKLAIFYKTIDGNQSNTEYLQKLVSIKTKQQFLQSSVLNLYHIMLALGLCLYMYEYASRMTIFWGIFAYGVSLGWIVFSWFYFRPKVIKKEQDRINGLIAKFEALNKQLEN